MPPAVIKRLRDRTAIHASQRADVLCGRRILAASLAIGQPVHTQSESIQLAKSDGQQRPIDLLRKAGGRIDVGDENDRSAIKGACVIAQSMHVIKEEGIYRVQLADEIDPERKNPAIPNTHQRVLSYGTNSPFVRQTLMTAKRLFDQKLLGQTFDYQRAIDLSFEALKDIAAMDELRADLAAKLKAINASQQALTPHDRVLPLPSVGNVRVKAETFLQKLDHIVVDLFGIASLFYGKAISKKWADSLLDLVDQRYGRDSGFSKFLEQAAPFLRFVRNARSCIEHTREGQELKVHDLTLNADGHIRPPTLEIVHAETPHPEVLLVEFMSACLERSANVFELMLAYLCAHNIQPISGLPIQVVQYPENVQRAFCCRYGYGVYDENGGVIPFG